MGGDDRGRCGQQHQRQSHRIRGEQEEGAFDRRRVTEEKSSDPEVGHEKRRHGEPEPPEGDRFASEMAHVGVERFATGHHQEQRAHRQESLGGVGGEVANGMDRIDRVEYVRCLFDAPHTEYGHHPEPEQHDRAEDFSDSAGAEALNGEQAHEDRKRNRNDCSVEPGTDQLGTFHRRHHADRRSDHSVAEEQTGSEQPEDPEGATRPATIVRRITSRRHERGKSENSALTVIVRPHDEQDIFDGDDDDQCPHDDRNRTEHVGALTSSS